MEKHTQASTVSTVRIRMAGAAVILAVVVALSGCGSFARPGGIKTGEIIVTAALDANENSPVAVDVVLVYDPAVIEKLVSLPAATWFAEREQFLRDAPDGIDVLRHEIVPGTTQTITVSNVQRLKASGAVIFVNYLNDGEHRLRIDALETVRLQLLKEKFISG
jgi:type VI secretion system protein